MFIKLDQNNALCSHYPLPESYYQNYSIETYCQNYPLLEYYPPLIAIELPPIILPNIYIEYKQKSIMT